MGLNLSAAVAGNPALEFLLCQDNADRGSRFVGD